MGLDLIEYVMAVEDAFGIAIPDEDAARLETAGQMVDYLCGRLGEASEGPPLIQSAFYRLRAAVAAELGIPPRRVLPQTDLGSLTDRSEREIWAAVGRRLGVEPKVLSHAPQWGWVVNLRKAPSRSFGAIAERLAMLRPAAVRPPSTPWTRRQVTEVVLRLLSHQNATVLSEADLGRRFVRDLGMG